MLQAALADSQFLDLFPFSDDGFVAPEVDVGGCDVVQTLMVSIVVVVIDEGPDLAFEITGQVVVFQQDPVLHRLMPALNFTLGLRVERCAANVIHFVILQPFGQITGDVAGPVANGCSNQWRNTLGTRSAGERWHGHTLTPPCANSIVAVTSSARMFVQSFQPMM